MARDKIKLKKLIVFFLNLIGILFVVCLVAFTTKVRYTGDFTVAKRYANARLYDDEKMLRDCMSQNDFVSLTDVKPAMEYKKPVNDVTSYEVINRVEYGCISGYDIKLKSGADVIETISIFLEAKNQMFGIYYDYKVISDDLKVKNQKIYTLDGAKIEIDGTKIDEIVGKFDDVTIKDTSLGKCYMFKELYRGKHKIKVYGKFFEEREYEIDFDNEYKEHYVTDLNPTKEALSICREKLQSDFQTFVDCSLLGMDLDYLKDRIDFYDENESEQQSEYRKLKNRFKKYDDGTGVVLMDVLTEDANASYGNIKGCLYIKVDVKIPVVTYRLRRVLINGESNHVISRSEKENYQSITYLYNDGKWRIYRFSLYGKT